MVLRTCVACRKTADKRELLRFVAVRQGEAKSDWALVLDLAQRHPGRGAYVHAFLECVVTPKVVTALIASLVRAAKQRGEDLHIQARPLSVMIEDGLRGDNISAADRERMLSLLAVPAQESPRKFRGKSGRVRL